MRITPQQLQLKLSDLKINKAPAQVKLGDAFTAKIIAVQTQAILISLGDGSSLRALVQSPERFVEGQVLEFIVTEEPSEGLVKVAINNEVVESKVLLDTIKNTLESVDLKNTDENIKAYQMLKSFSLPVTKENIQLLTQNFKYLNRVSEGVETKLMDNSGDFEKVSNQLNYNSPKEMLEAPIKEVVIRLLNAESQGVIQNDSQEIIKTEAKVTENVTVNTVPDEEFVSKQLEGSQKQVDGERQPLLKEALGLLKDFSGQLNIEDTMEKLGVLLKLDKPVTLKNVNFIDKVMMGKENIGEQLKVLLEQPILKDLKVLSTFKGIDLKSIQSEDFLKEQFSEIIRELDQVKTHVSSRVQGDIDKLIETISFLKKEQEDVSWIQLPISYNEKTENLEMFIKNDKKESGNYSKDNVKILIALDTHYIGNVQALISIKDTSLDIGFTLSDEKVESLFKQNYPTLKKLLNDDFNIINIHTKVSGKISFKEFVEDDSVHHINVKV